MKPRGVLEVPRGTELRLQLLKDTSPSADTFPNFRVAITCGMKTDEHYRNSEGVVDKLPEHGTYGHGAKTAARTYAETAPVDVGWKHVSRNPNLRKS